MTDRTIAHDARREQGQQACDTSSSNSTSQSVPKRRFAPQLVETSSSSSSSTSKSQKINNPNTPVNTDRPMSPDVKPPSRRFIPDLVETTITTSRSSSPATARPKSPNPSSQQHQQQITPRRARFVPEPLETTTRSHKASSSSLSTMALVDDVPLLPHERLAPPPASPRPFSPKPKDSSSRPISHSPEPTSVRRRFAPQMVETSTRSHRSPSRSAAAPSPKPEMSSSADSTATQQQSRPPKRRFEPMLLETATRTRKAGDTSPALLPTDKTNISPGDALNQPKPHPRPPLNTPSHSTYDISTPFFRPLPNRQGSLHVHYNTPRSHSYAIPTLDVIESSGSSEGSTPSRSKSNSMSDMDNAERSISHQRESVDDRFSGYLLALAARAAEKQLREQEAAAFATSDFHSPVVHYANLEESDEDLSEPVMVAGHVDTYRRDSGDERYELMELQRHGERMEKMNKKALHQQKKQAAKGPAPQRKKTAAFNVEFDSEVHHDAWITHQPSKNIISEYQGVAAPADPDLKCMRKAASPPMLGGDIDFPRCASPDHARFDVTQGCDFLRTNMCYLTQHGMWDGKSRRPDMQSRDSETSKSSQSPTASKKKENAGGLWGGFCTGAENEKMTPQVQSGLVTPIRTPSAIERDDPFAQFSSGASCGTSVAGKRPGPPSATVGYPSPPSSSSAQLDEALEIEAKLDAEFNDDFITQVFNYLSLGYPALARKFDDELCKISGVPVDQLRCDDQFADAHGYLRLGEEEPTCEDLGVERGDCKRWVALRQYCREWGRQMIINASSKEAAGAPKEDPHRAWGLPARKGSWSN